MIEGIQTGLYELSQQANQLVAEQLTHISPLTLTIVCLAGLLTSLTPCMLSMLPIMVGYMGGYETNNPRQAIFQSTGSL